METGITRGVINERIGRIVRMLSWGTAEEYVPASVVQACRELRNLQAGRCGDIPEQRDVQPVTLEQVEAVRSQLTLVLRAMVDIELLTGMRPQEVRNMTWGQIDRSDAEVWCYQPRRHKTKGKGKMRRIFIGPSGQRILSQFLKLDPEAFIFSPKDSEAERHATMRANRITPLTPSQRLRDQNPKSRVLLDHYTKDSYRRAIVRACEKAFDMPDHLRRIPGMPEFFGPVLMRVRVVGTCIAGTEAEASPKPEWKQYTSARTQLVSDTPANYEDDNHCN